MDQSKKRVKLIALDLDGTLLSSKKTLTDENRRALEEAAELGVFIVPTTGRIYSGIPNFIRALPFVRYAICLNGAEVFDAENKTILSKDYLSHETYIPIIEHLKTLPAVFDLCLEDAYLMSKSDYDKLEQFIFDDAILNMVRELRTPVADLTSVIQDKKCAVKKIVAFFESEEIATQMRKEMSRCFGNVSITSSYPNNIEINSITANKGNALCALCKHLGLSVDDAMSFGDGLNDISMIEAAGLGVAMGNACDEVISAADFVTLSNDENGVAKTIREHILNST